MLRTNVLLCMLLLGLTAGHLCHAQPVTALTGDIGQKAQPLEYIEVPGEPDAYYHVQRTREGDDRLFLTANNVYFNPIRRLVAAGEGPEQVRNDGAGLPTLGGRGLNQGASFAFITRWAPEDVAEWGVWLEQGGKLEVYVQTSGAAGATFIVRIGEQEKRIVSQAEEDGGVKLAAHLTFDIDAPGFHNVQVICVETDPQNDVLFNWMELSGPATKGGGVVRVRWRPSATHAQFTSSKMSTPVRMWVIEMNALPGTHNFYGPITTPFGYYGPSWQADGEVSGNLNFSLWSYGRRAEEPPLERLSQIIAIGNPDAEFSGFAHEGTGAKIRNWSPFRGRQEQRQVLALRLEPGQPTENHDRYYAYFYAEDEQRWRLFGVGEKYNNNRRTAPEEMPLRIGSFVEVVGGARRERSGIYPRRMRYRGWVMDNHGQWYPLDRMTHVNANRELGLTPSIRGIDDDGWFFNQTGGWKWYRPSETRGDGYVEQDNPARMEDMDYLTEEDLQVLMSVPSKISVDQLTRRGNDVIARFTVYNAGQNGKVTAFWGSEDGRALRDRWPHSQIILDNVRDGVNEAVIPNVPPGGNFYVRLLLENEEGRFFTWETASIKP